MTEQYITDMAAGNTGYQPSTDVRHWTAADADSISADSKIFTSAHLCEWRLSTEIIEI